MRLSTSMMLGATTHKLNSDFWDCCLLGVSVKAIGAKTRNEYGMESRERWPWINRSMHVPCFMGWSSEMLLSVEDIISNAAKLVESGCVRLETVVDWVRSIEPPEPEDFEVETAEPEDFEVETAEVEALCCIFYCIERRNGCI